MPDKKMVVAQPTFNKEAAMPDVVVKNSANRGNENVTAKERIMPRLRLLQPGSPELKKSRDEYIPGAEEGMWHNSATGEVFVSLYVMNLYFRVEYVVFDDSAIGAEGFIGVFETREEAEAFLESTDQKDIERKKGKVPVINESHNHFVMVIGPDGKPAGVARLDCIKSRIKRSSMWNTQIAEYSRLDGGGTADRFASVWNVRSFVDKNGSNEWHNLKTEYAGVAPVELYNLALNMYDGIHDQISPTEAEVQNETE